ncbi:MAG: lactate racemase domain-containing protein [Candidatus Latescibacterota bacterium]
MPVQSIDPRQGLLLYHNSFYGAIAQGRLEARSERKRLTFPPDWRVTAYYPHALDRYPRLDDAALRASMHRPIGCPLLSELARQYGSAAVLVDDLSRPTPAYRVVGPVLQQIQDGGIPPNRIRILIATGTHRPLVKFDHLALHIEKKLKLGEAAVERYEVLDHDFTDEETYNVVAEIDEGPPVRVNKHLAESLVVGISGVYPHGGAGFGGGAKIILPGVSHKDLIDWNHRTLEWQAYGTIYPEVITRPGIRRHMEKVARAVGLDFTLQIVTRPDQEIIGLFCGDFIHAHRRACCLAWEAYETPVPADSPDVILVNGYPFDTDAGQVHRGDRFFQLHDRGVNVLFGGCYDQIAYHGQEGGYREFLQDQEDLEQTPTYAFRSAQTDLAAHGEVVSLLHAPYLNARIYGTSNPRFPLYGDWEALVDAAASFLDHSRSEVAVFPFAPLQLAAGARPV